MADKSDKKSLRKRKGKKATNEEEKLTKDETEAAKYLRWNLNTKKSVMYGDEVYYFTGSKIVDFMLDSKWATGKAKRSSIEFTDRDSTYSLLDKMIALGLFSRVHRIYKEKEKKGKDKKDEKKKIKDEKPKTQTKAEDVKQSPKAEKKDKSKDSPNKESKDGKKKKKVKVTLEPNEHNIFVDLDDAVFIWIYDPVHPKTFVLGILLVIGAIAVCLFPLWPESFRAYSWYLSVLAMLFIGIILFLAIFRYVVFGIVWGASFGKLHFWLLPNLTADCGFLESFMPIYEYCVPTGACDKTEDTNEDEDRVENDNDQGDVKLKENDSSNNEEKDTIHPIQEEKQDEKDDNKEDSSGTVSGSNRDIDEGDSWVKVKKSDINSETEKTDEIKC